MKNIPMFACLGIIMAIVFMSGLNVQSNMNRESEIEDSLSTSLRNTVKATSVNKMYDVSKEEMSAELLRNLAQNVNTDGEFDVYVYGADTQGFMDVKLKESHVNINGKTTFSEVRKSLVLEETPIE